MRVLRSIVQPLVLPMLQALEHLVLSRFVAPQFVDHDSCGAHSGYKALLLKEDGLNKAGEGARLETTRLM
jgi:hypothetical protein